MEVKAQVKNLRSTPRKTRLVIDLVRGKNLKKAISELKFVNKKASSLVSSLLNSAKANAENNFSLDSEKLYIKTIQANEGKKMKRYRAGSKGSARPIKRRLSDISVVLATEEEIKSEEKKVKKVSKKEVEKTSIKKTETKEDKK